MKINHYQTVAIDILQEIEAYVVARADTAEAATSSIVDNVHPELRAYWKGQLAAYLEIITVLNNFYTPEVTPDATNSDQA